MDRDITPSDYVTWAYRLLLGREPESDEAIRGNPWAADRKQLVHATLLSSEFREKNPDIRVAFWGEVLQPHFPGVCVEIRKQLLWGGDPVRTYTIALALETIRREQLAGALAELGVYRGDTAVLYHRICPEKRLFLFDTFEGFPERDLDGRADERFADTSIEAVKARFTDHSNIIFRKGYFPDTTVGLEGEKFCFVMLDADLYNPTLAGLQFFYERMVSGGYVFAHDYSSYESGGAVSRAFTAFLQDKPEKVIEIPDEWGTVLFRKI
jgi:O-methyltransferase